MLFAQKNADPIKTRDQLPLKLYRDWECHKKEMGVAFLFPKVVTVLKYANYINKTVISFHLPRTGTNEIRQTVVVLISMITK